MRHLWLLVGLLGLLVSGPVWAASYQMIDGTIVDPILTTVGSVHPYNGSDLLPNGDYNAVDLSNANLVQSALSSAIFNVVNLSSVNFTDADLSASTLNVADLTNADFRNADLVDAAFDDLILEGTDFSGTDFSNANGLGTRTPGVAFYSPTTNFTGTGFDPVAAGWQLVPEPSTALLLGLGLVGMAARRLV